MIRLALLDAVNLFGTHDVTCAGAIAPVNRRRQGQAGAIAGGGGTASGRLSRR